MVASRESAALSKLRSVAGEVAGSLESDSSEHFDPQLVKCAVDDLNAIYAAKALETACLIGNYVLDRFFDGDPDLFVRNGGKQPSFRALAKHQDLRISATYLWTAVSVVRQVRELPEELARRLPLSHHRLLLPVKDPAMKMRLAERAVECGMSKRELAREIGRQKGRRRRVRTRGRSKNENVLKALSHLVEASEEFVLAASSKGAELKRSNSRGTAILLRRLELDLDAVRCALVMLSSRYSERTSPPPGRAPVNPPAGVWTKLSDG